MGDDVDSLNEMIKRVREHGATDDDFIDLALMVRHMRELIGGLMGEGR